MIPCLRCTRIRGNPISGQRTGHVFKVERGVWVSFWLVPVTLQIDGMRCSQKWWTSTRLWPSYYSYLKWYLRYLGTLQYQIQLILLCKTKVSWLASWAYRPTFDTRRPLNTGVTTRSVVFTRPLAVTYGDRFCFVQFGCYLSCMIVAVWLLSKQLVLCRWCLETELTEPGVVQMRRCAWYSISEISD